jgi:glycosyltransferase involved in cell wall biosynthesis
VRIVFLCEAVFPENKGGVERWFNRLTQELAARGHDVVYLNAAGVNEERLGVLYRSITRKPWGYLPGGVRSKRQAATFSLEALKELRSIEADAIYATAVPILSVFAVGLIGLLKRRTKTFVEWFEIWPFRYWLEYSGWLTGTIGWITQFLALQIGMYRVTYTHRAFASIKSQNTLPFNGSIIKFPGLCSQKFETVPDSEKLRNDITFLGRFVDEKQPIVAIEAVIDLVKKGWTGNFWIIGKGPSLSMMREKLAANEIEARQIHIIEDASDEIVSQHLKSSFALLHPSKREGYGLASVEAAYLGTPSVLLNYPNNATVDLMISPELVARDYSTQEIVNKLQYALENQSTLRKATLGWARSASHDKSLNSTADKIERILGVIDAK